MNSKIYTDMLETKLKTFMGIHQCTSFMQDSAPCHVARSSLEWFRKNAIELLEWPGNSPDCNPIENIWTILKKRVSLRRPTSIAELKEAIKSVWDTEITDELCKACVNSMPKRLEAIIKAHGGQKNTDLFCYFDCSNTYSL